MRTGGAPCQLLPAPTPRASRLARLFAKAPDPLSTFRARWLPLACSLLGLLQISADSRPNLEPHSRGNLEEEVPAQLSWQNRESPRLPADLRCGKAACGAGVAQCGPRGSHSPYSRRAFAYPSQFQMQERNLHLDATSRTIANIVAMF